MEVDRCDLPSVNLLTPLLDFQHVPQGPMGMVRETALAITFEVTSPSGPVTLQYAAGRRARAPAARGVQHRGHGRADRRPPASRPPGCG